MMSTQNVLKLTPEEAQEIPMVDLAFAVLKNANNPMYYRDLMQEISKIKGLSDDDVMRVIAQVYTEINIDGRFACVGNNLWGLKRWYPVDKSEDSVGTHPRIINDDDDDDLDDETLFADEGEDYTADEDFDEMDEDEEESEDLFDEDSEEIEDEELDEELSGEEESIDDEEAEDSEAELDEFEEEEDQEVYEDEEDN
jgi:DNA-directed RNA polymerase subunit delta